MTGPTPGIARVSLGRTGVTVSRLILGCAPLAGLFAPVEAGAAAATLAAAWDSGVRAFDTAPHYGAGLSEERLGSFLADKVRPACVVSTKVGRLLVPTDDDVEGVEGFFGAARRSRVYDYSRDGVRRSLEQSCARMGLDRVDVALIHDPDEHWDIAINEAYPALEELRSEGVVAAIGVGMNQTTMIERFVAETDIDCVLTAGHYSLLDSSAGDSLFPACVAAGVAVLAAGVYQSGILANPRPGAMFNYRVAPPEITARVSQIARVCAAHAVPLPAAALHYVVANPAVTAVVIGARSAGEADDNARHLNTIVPPELFDELAALGLVAPLTGAAPD